MVGKRVQFDDERWEAIVALARRNGSSFEGRSDHQFGSGSRPCSVIRSGGEQGALDQGERNPLI